MVNSQSTQNSGRKLFYGLFIFPLIIAVGMAVLLCTVVLLTREVETPESLITAIKTGSPSKRWQKAFELSNELNQGRALLRKSGVMKEVIHILNNRTEYDAKTRSFMAIALSRFDDPEVVPAIQETLRQEPEPDVQLYLLWALGIKHATGAQADVEPFVQSEHEEIKNMAIYVLGGLGQPESVPLLEPILDDDSRDVRWNAALSLARLGSSAGYAELMKMLDRETLTSVENLTDAKIEEIMINAIRGIVILDKREALPTLAKIAKTDPSLKVRQTAIEAFKDQSLANAA